MDFTVLYRKIVCIARRGRMSLCYAANPLKSRTSCGFHRIRHFLNIMSIYTIAWRGAMCYNEDKSA